MFYYFIVNPNSGAGKGLRAWNHIKQFLNKQKTGYEVHFTAGTGDARELAKQLTENCHSERCIIAVGGEGTMNEVLDGISFSCPVVLGFIPSGCRDTLLKSMGLPRDRRRWADKLLLNCDAKPADYGVVSSAESGCIRRFLISTGVGFEAAVCKGLLKEPCEEGQQTGRGFVTGGRLKDLQEALKQLFFAKPVRGWILLDGEQRIEFNNIISISARILPQGGLELCVVSARSKLKVLWPLLREDGLLRRAKPGVRLFSCSEAHIHTEFPLAVHADWENCKEQTDLDVRCVRGQLRFLR